MKTITNIIYPTFALFTLACFALSPQARAVCQQGCDTDNSNTFLGDRALIRNTTGSFNTATGFLALFSNTDGVVNTATGAFALQNNRHGGSNTATGYLALVNNLNGSGNTATGVFTLYNNTGDHNTATGLDALMNLSSGSGNTALGESAGINLTTGSSNIDIGNTGVATESGIIRIGTPGTHTATFIAGISETPLANGVAVGITADGQLGVRASSARFKTSVKPMDKTSEAIYSLRPVTFRYNKDRAAVPQFGLVAEEVAKVNPDLVARDVEGKPFTVRYDEINAMLLNEFLKARRQIDAQQKQIEALTAGLQKVTAQVEMSRPASQMVLNKQ